MTIKLRSHVGADGVLELKLPSGMTETDVEVTVTVQPVSSEANRIEWQEFVGQTAGHWGGEPLERAPQGEYDVRIDFE